MRDLLFGFVSILLISVCVPKRCKGRFNAGHSCGARCNYRTGQWNKNSCGQGPEYCFEKCETINGKEQCKSICSTIRWTPEVGQCPTLIPWDDLPTTTRSGICHFPFTWDGQTYNRCMVVEGSIQDLRFCVTNQDNEGVDFWACNLNHSLTHSLNPNQDYPGTIEGKTYEEECFNAPTCHTIGGESVHADCVFPFKYAGVTYNGCTKNGADDGIPWCSTQTDENGVYVSGQGKWGHCSDDCPKQSRKSESMGNAGDQNCWWHLRSRKSENMGKAGDQNCWWHLKSRKS